jgi:hypothetical protein
MKFNNRKVHREEAKNAKRNQKLWTLCELVVLTFAPFAVKGICLCPATVLNWITVATFVLSARGNEY